MIQVIYSEITLDLYTSTYQTYLTMLPKQLQEKNLKFLRWQDRATNLFGKLLLVEALKEFGFNHEVLNNICYTRYNRPYLIGDIDFNISHSGKYVVCAVGQGIRLGIDIEKMDPIDFEHFESVMANLQWDIIKDSKDPIQSFYLYWTSKESAIKADGRGLTIPLKNIHIHDNTIQYDGKTWYLKELNINNNYCTSIATDHENISTEITCKSFCI